MTESVKLRRKFYRELPEYQDLLARQGGVCKICGRLPQKYRLSVDHDHAYDRIKLVITSDVGMKKWFAECNYNGEHFYAFGDTRQEAWKLTKLQIFHRAIRGLICMRCNKGISFFEDSKAPLKPAERFDAAAKYFRDFEGGFYGT